jgi:hypothetical protein
MTIYEDNIVETTTNTNLLSFKSIKHIWDTVKPAYLENVKYSLAPIHLFNNNSCDNTNNIFVIGVVILDYKQNIKLPSTLGKYKKIPLLCDLARGCTVKNDTNYLNLFKGILQHSQNNLATQIIKVQIYSDNDKHIHSLIDVPLLHAVSNMMNYIIKFQVKRIEKEELPFYKVFSKSSKSIKLPTSLPATLSGASN